MFHSFIYSPIYLVFFIKNIKIRGKFKETGVCHKVNTTHGNVAVEEP